MKSHCLVLLVALSLGLVKPVIAGPPCKTAEELRAAFETCLKTGDTNQFWKLHCWTNVSAANEKLHKNLSAGMFIHGTEPRPVYTVKLSPAPPDSNTPRPMRKGGHMKPNIPVTGVVAYTAQSKTMTIENFLAYGKGPDGNFWLAVDIVVPGTNAPSGRAAINQSSACVLDHDAIAE